MKNTLLITGATGSIGGALSDILYKKNILPIITYNQNRKKANQLSEKYSSQSIHLDLSNTESINNLVNKIMSNHLNLFGVILCASPNFEIAPFTKINLDHIYEQLEINVVGNHKLLSCLIKKIFRKNKKGIVIGILSEAMGKPLEANIKNMSPYIVSKYGLLGLLSAMKAEFQWLDVDTISPGFTESSILKSFDERFLDNMRKNNEINKPQNVANDIYIIIDKILKSRNE